MRRPYPIGRPRAAGGCSALGLGWGEQTLPFHRFLETHHACHGASKFRMASCICASSGALFDEACMRACKHAASTSHVHRAVGTWGVHMHVLYACSRAHTCTRVRVCNTDFGPFMMKSSVVWSRAASRLSSMCSPAHSHPTHIHTTPCTQTQAHDEPAACT